MERERICGIYKIKNLVNGKIYVGQSINIYGRWHEHKRELRINHHYNKYLQRSWNKYKEENFEFSILEITEQSKLNEKEIYWIDNLSTYQPKGFNLSFGGGGNLGLKHSQETKDKISKLQTGRRLTEEWKTHISISHKGKMTKNIQILLDLNEACKVNIKQYSLKGIFIKEWVGILECARELNIEATNLVKALKGKHKSCSGFIWKYSDDNYISKDREYDAEHKKVMQFDLNMKMIRTWNSINEICLSLDILSTGIYKCCLRETSKSHNYIWIYEEDYASDISRKPLTVSKKVIQYDLNDNIIKVWDSSKIAADYFNGYRQNIGCACIGKASTAYGFKWKYEETTKQ